MPKLRNEHICILVEVRDRGGSLREIGSRLGLSKPVVGSRLSEIYKVLDVFWMDNEARRDAAVEVAEELGLLPAVFTPTIVDVPTGDYL